MFLKILTEISSSQIARYPKKIFFFNYAAAEDGTAVDTTAEDATADGRYGGWTVRRNFPKRVDAAAEHMTLT